MTTLTTADWGIEPGDRLTFAVEVVIFLGFFIITILLGLMRNRYPQLTTNGWIELVIGSLFIALKGLFDGLDTISPDSFSHDVFDSLEAGFMFLGLILLGVGLTRIAFYSSKVWEVR